MFGNFASALTGPALQIGKHTAEHATSVAISGCLQTLACIETDDVSTDLRGKARKALKAIIAKLSHLPALDNLIQHPLSDSVTKDVLEQLGKVLGVNAEGRATFVRSGGLERIQRIAQQPGNRHRELVAAVNSQYPEEIVKFHSPGYGEQLLAQLSAGVE